MTFLRKKLEKKKSKLVLFFSGERFVGEKANRSNGDHGRYVAFVERG